jgi:hypothetical protein
MSRTSKTLELSVADKTQLSQWRTAHGTPQQVALRCQIVLAAANGEENIGPSQEHGNKTFPVAKPMSCRNKTYVIIDGDMTCGHTHT